MLYGSNSTVVALGFAALIGAAAGGWVDRRGRGPDLPGWGVIAENGGWCWWR